MRRFRVMVQGLPLDSAYCRTLALIAAERPASPRPIRRGRTSADTIRRFGGRVIDTREDTG